MSLSFRLVVVCAVAVLPAAGIQLWDELALRRARQVELQAEAQRMAVYAASEVGRVIDATRQLLIALGEAPVVSASESGLCSDYVAALERRFPEYSRLAVADAAGTLLCIARKLPPGHDIAERPYFQAAVQSRDFVVGGYLVGRLTGRSLLPIAQPVLGRDGKVARVAIATLDLDILSARLQERGLPPGGSITLADRHGVIVARAPLPERFVGTRIPEAFLPLLHAAEPSSLEVMSQDGTRRMLGYVPLGAGPPGLYVSAGLSTDVAFDLIDRSTWAGLLLILAGFVSAVLAAAMAGRLYLAPPVRQLLQAAERWRAGDLTARVGAIAGGSELSRLGAGFDRMADALEARTAELRGNEEWLRLAQEAGRVGAWAWDPAADRVRWSGGLRAMVGLQPEDSDERGGFAPLLTLVHPADRPALAEAIRQAPHTGTLDHEFRVLRPLPDGSTALRWLTMRGRAQIAAAGGPGSILGVAVDVTARHEAEERQLVLMREVDHRAKNTLAVVQAVLRLTPKADPAAYAQAIEGRVLALARAHTLLAEGRWAGARLHDLVEGELQAFLGERGAPGPRASLIGPPVTLNPAGAQAVSMAIHELATNAVKHGALSVEAGRIAVTWSLDQRSGLLRLQWEEQGGPAVERPPTRRGFGSRVLEATIGAQLGGHVERRWSPGGLLCILEIPLTHGRASDRALEASPVDLA